MADYTPTYQKTAPMTIVHPEPRVESLWVMHAYASSHDDVPVKIPARTIKARQHQRVI